MAVIDTESKHFHMHNVKGTRGVEPQWSLKKN